MGAAVLGVGSAVVGGALQLKGISDQEKIDKSQSKFQARVAKNNAVRAEAAAQDAEKRGRRDEGVQRSATRQAIGQSRANAAARGVEVDTGSAASIAGDIAEVGELDALQIRENARREAFSFRQQGEDFTAQAEQQRIASKNISRAASTQRFSTLINSGTSVASRWYRGGF